MTLRIAVLGLGEAGSEIARDLVAAGADVRGYDPKGISVDGVQPRGSEADAVADADLVLSVNSSHDAMTALENALPALRAGTLWADLNTASPGLKEALADRAASATSPVVDVALMSPVPGKGLRTPMLVSGEAADRYAELLAGLGADVAVQPGPVGTAISRKLLRSVFYKGLAAAVVEALRGAEAAGCADWLRGNIAAELAGLRRADRRPAGRRHARARPAPGRRDGGRHRAAGGAGRAGPHRRGRPRPAGGAPGRDRLPRGRPRDHRLPRPLHHRAGGPHRLARAAGGGLGGGHDAAGLPVDQRRRDPRDDRGQPAAADGRAGHRRHAVLAAGVGDGATTSATRR